jgi:hypothetical protein
VSNQIVARKQRYFPVEHGVGVFVVYILKEGMSQDYAVYAGIGSDAFVCQQGVKLSKDEGRELFGAHIDAAGLEGAEG